MPRILVSNDDGVFAKGIDALQKAMADLGEVWVVAPDREQSATSHSISLHEPLRLRQVSERVFGVDGTPTDAVYLALNHIMRGAPPDVVVSGINQGPNLGNDVLYSGTVAAAMEGALFGFPAVAVSLCLPDTTASDERTWHFETAAAAARSIVRDVLSTPMPSGVVLNINVPNCEAAALAGYKLCRLGYTDWSDEVTVRHDPRGRRYFWIGGERNGHDTIADSDNNAIRERLVTLTPIHYDLTDYRAFSWARRLRVEGLPAAPDGLGDGPLGHPPHPRAKLRQW